MTDVVELRDYIEAMLAEQQRALVMAAAERDRAAEVLRDEQRRALQVAEAEREKSAAALRAGTDRAIADNYERLREQLEAMRREISAAQASSKEAIVKAEAANEKRFEAMTSRLAALESAQIAQSATGAATVRSQDRSQPWQVWVAGTFVTLVMVTAATLLGSLLGH